MGVGGSGFARVGATLVTMALVGACSLVVDTSGLAGGAPDQAPNDGSVDGARLVDASTPADGAGAGDSGGGSVGSDGGVDGAACQPLDAPCGGQACCASLRCGDAKRCLTCLPKFDDCTSNAQCCSNNCSQLTTICE